MSHLGEGLKQAVLNRYRSDGLSISKDPQTAVKFKATDPAIGDLIIADDVDEITVYLGSLTHSHFSCYEPISEEEKVQIIVANVISFLDDLFADHILMWIAEDSTRGGWRRLESGELRPEPNARNYVWSGPL
jgi:hypothetical protein